MFIMAIIAILLGLLVFKLTVKMFSLSIRLLLFGLTTAVIIVPSILCLLVF